MLSFELVGGEVADGGVLALVVVVGVDVVEEFELGIGGIFKAAALKHLALEGPVAVRLKPLVASGRPVCTTLMTPAPPRAGVVLTELKE